jgi:hypothetical protein
MVDGSEIRTVVSNEDTVVVERLDVNLIAGVRVTFHVTAIFEVRDGAITCWREYWDTGDIARHSAATRQTCLSRSSPDLRCGIMSWTAEQLALVDVARELDIAVRRADGTLRPWTPIWVVHVGGDVYVRTWYRRDTGWFGLALSTRRARVRVPGVEVDVRIEAVGVGPSGLREDVDDAYRAKYGGGSTGNMVGDEAAATTLRFNV